MNDEFFYHIGMIVNSWSGIEAQLEFVILGTQEIKFETGMVITAKLGFQQKLQLMRLFNNEQAFEPKSTKEEVNKLLNTLGEAYEIRNNVAHIAWFPTDNPLIAKRQAVKIARKKLMIIDEEMHLDKLRDMGEKVFNAGKSLYDFAIIHSFHS